jgi:hypothetical protein
MTSRDDVIATLRTEITKVGLTDTSEKVLKVAVLAGVTKQIIVGKSKYQVVDWMNKQRRQTGPDMWYVYDDVYTHIKDVNF